ncbi:hypothetical protein BV22DRAFT_927664 [Leucogyrophana mollusca]|uniref:Uncharacterized protein n=1 Tax=Leucogyrophana mollusca TaxID=85980 RepID=A0ACB8AXA7_9AGAM|nr:hypothetical protein BV22DRAFT_927664 [Leucogyrophana mollusca]
MNLNILMDAKDLYIDGFRPCQPRVRRDLKGEARHFTGIQRPPGYFLIDFGISCRYDASNTNPLEYPIWGDNTVPQSLSRVVTDKVSLTGGLFHSAAMRRVTSTSCGRLDRFDLVVRSSFTLSVSSAVRVVFTVPSTGLYCYRAAVTSSFTYVLQSRIRRFL